MSTLDNLKKLPLAKYCLNNLGYKPVHGDCKSWRKLESSCGVKIYTSSKPNATTGHYTYGDNFGKGGTIIDLLKDIHGYDMNKIYQLANNCNLTCNIVTVAEPFKKQEPKWLTKNEIIKLYNSINHNNEFNYFSRRQISQAVVKKFRLKADTYSTIFPLYRFVGDNFILCSAQEYRFDSVTGSTRKKFLGPKADSFSILSLIKGLSLDLVDTIYLFESPVDALSFFQLYSPNNYNASLLISTCGVPSKGFFDALKFFLEKNNKIKLVSCFDNDDAGYLFSNRAEALVEGQRFERLLPKGKDFNEDLRIKKLEA